MMSQRVEECFELRSIETACFAARRFWRFLFTLISSLREVFDNSFDQFVLIPPTGSACRAANILKSWQ
jgi:hypothetical protein